MKRWIVLLVVLLAMNVNANDLRVVLKDSISVADTVATSKRIDTVVSDAFNIGDAPYINFYKVLKVNGINADTNWTNDTFFVKFQTSWDRNVWQTYEIDTFLDNTAGNRDEFSLIRADSIYGNWARLMLIHWDSLEADAADIVNNVYYKECELWISIKQ